MAATTRERILDAAQELMQTRSFTGFSFDDLAKRVGIRKPSLYHHFRSKDELGVEVLARVAGRLDELSKTSGARNGAEQLQAYLDTLGELLGAGEKLCPGGSFSASWGVLPNAIRNSVRRMGSVHFAWIGRVLEQGRADGSLKPQRSTEVAARWVFATVQGALMLARIAGEPQVYAQTTAQLMDALRSSKG
jgi:TetR/AcrR family transcriptional regulator, transcriptional repressor for nem operon